MKFANFPKTFGIEELAKGYFPHLFNKKENENYIGPIPPTPYYNPNGMSPKDSETFLAWHTSKKESNYAFNFKEEIVKYCRSDVDILRRCSLEFRELFHEITEIDPFRTLTIASVCHKVYRTKYLPKDTIVIIPPLGYTPKAKQSLVAHKWLSYLSEKNDVFIQHALDGGEKRVGKYFLDGYCEEIHTAFAFHGCFWHGEFVFSFTCYCVRNAKKETFLFTGCRKCYARDTVNPVSSNTMDELYQATVEKTEYLKRNGYNLVEMWECDMKRELEEGEDMKHYFDHYHVADPLEPRDAIYTADEPTLRNCIIVAKQTKRSTMWTLRVCILTLTDQKPYRSVIPRSLPKTLIDQDVSNYFGLIKCTVLPPRSLFHPVLPYRTQGKLMFALCKTCADTCSQTPCTHSDTERAIQGTWCTVELMKAVEKRIPFATDPRNLAFSAKNRYVVQRIYRYIC